MPRLTLRALLLGLACPIAAACARPLDERECERLLDHYTELLVKEEDPTATPEHVAQALEDARRLAATDPRFEMSACPRKIGRKSFECAMAAPSVDAVERCLIF
ncbi:MAG TPA: hypothetical protein VHE30_12740 [Polyangiaceae bacterium]|nr:hypothetical protein [Polyangiaceae bacterium]